MNAANYVIIGNSVGAIGAAEAIRGVDRVGSILMIGDEAYPAYSRPMIADYLAGRSTIDRMLFRPADFYDANGVQAVLGERVVRLDVDQHRITLGGGAVLTWEKLLLATGGSPIVPAMTGIGLEGVFTFGSLEDARAIDSFLCQVGRGNLRAVVVGGGLIGASVAEALVRRGVRVTIIEIRQRILSAILDQEAAAFQERKLLAAGIGIVTGHAVAEVCSGSSGQVCGVDIDDGHHIPCDLVVVAIGVVPRTELAVQSGIRTRRGIPVDRHMATSVPDVFACGDVAESFDFVRGDVRLTPIWPNAYAGGKTAGLNMAGVSAEYRGCTTMNSMKYCGAEIVSAGVVDPPDDSYEEICNRHHEIYRKVVVKDGTLAGMVFCGDIEKAGIIYNLMRDRVVVQDFKHVLVADDFGLTALPEEIWRARVATTPRFSVAAPALA